jgi:hypothetical protein
LSSARTREDRGKPRGDRASKPPDLNGARVRREPDHGKGLTSGSPPPRLLFVVATDQLSFYRHLARGFDGSDEVQVILDRRTADRRCGSSPPARERRREERRAVASAAVLRSPGWLMTWSRTAPGAEDGWRITGERALEEDNGGPLPASKQP